MSIQLKNDVVFLESTDGNRFDIYPVENAGANTVGQVTLIDGSPAGLDMEIKEAYRGKHYASNAVYLLTLYVHNQKQVPEIRVSITEDLEMVKHILEHAGYQMLSDEEANVFIHRAEKTKDTTGYTAPEGNKVIYLAGGCFWGTQRAFDALKGVTATEVGYANGHAPNPTYEMICRNETGYRETVRVTYDPSVVSLETILKAYFIVTDPTSENRQGNDIGTQYQSGIYWKDAEDEKTVRAFCDGIRSNYRAFHVELKELECFYTAEEYHQDYLVKHPDGYCHVTRIDLEEIKRLNA